MYLFRHLKFAPQNLSPLRYNYPHENRYAIYQTYFQTV